ARRAMHSYAAILSGALALGGGIWATHFIGMLAHQLPVPVSYSAPLTLLSLLPAFAASGFALRMLAMSRVTPRHMLCLEGRLWDWASVQCTTAGWPPCRCRLKCI